MESDTIDGISRRELLLYLFGCGADQNLTIFGYKHRKAVAAALDNIYRTFRYNWNEEFWGPHSSEFKRHVVGYDNEYIYYTNIALDSECEHAPIHHKSMFSSKGIYEWVRIHKKIGKDIDPMVIMDSIVYFSITSPLLISYSLKYSPQKPIKSSAENINKWLYPASWDGKKPSIVEINWLKKRYVDMGLKSWTNSPSIEVSIPQSFAGMKFEYLRPVERRKEEFLDKSKDKLKDVMKSPFVRFLQKKGIISENKVNYRFNEIIEEKFSDIVALHKNYEKEIDRIEKLTDDLSLRLIFGNDAVELKGKDEVDRSTYRYIWHLLQPVENISLKRQMDREEAAKKWLDEQLAKESAN